GGVWLHDPITHNFFRYIENSSTPTTRIPVPEATREVENWCLGQDAEGALLACFEGHGLWRYSGKWKQVKAPGLPIESPISLVKGAGQVWLGYAHNQIALDDASGFRIYGEAEGLGINSVLTFYDFDGFVLAGGFGGLGFFDWGEFHFVWPGTLCALWGS